MYNLLLLLDSTGAMNNEFSDTSWRPYTIFGLLLDMNEFDLRGFQKAHRTKIAPSPVGLVTPRNSTVIQNSK